MRSKNWRSCWVPGGREDERRDLRFGIWLGVEILLTSLTDHVCVSNQWYNDHLRHYHLQPEPFPYVSDRQLTSDRFPHSIIWMVMYWAVYIVSLHRNVLCTILCSCTRLPLAYSSGRWFNSWYYSVLNNVLIQSVVSLIVSPDFLVLSI